MKYTPILLLFLAIGCIQQQYKIYKIAPTTSGITLPQTTKALTDLSNKYATGGFVQNNGKDSTYYIIYRPVRTNELYSEGSVPESAVRIVLTTRKYILIEFHNTYFESTFSIAKEEFANQLRALLR